MTFKRNILSKFTADVSRRQTHLCFRGGKFNVPDNAYDEFYREYFQALLRGEDLFLIEKVTDSHTAFFLDIESPKNSETVVTDAAVKDVITAALQCLESVLVDPDASYIVSKRVDEAGQQKYHVNFYNVIVNNATAQFLSKRIKTSLGPDGSKCIDASVYRTGLRMLGSKKTSSEATTYKVYDLDSGFTPYTDMTLSQFMKTVVRRNEATALTAVRDEHKKALCATAKNVTIRGIENAAVVQQIRALLDYIKTTFTGAETNEGVHRYVFNVNRIYATQNKTGIFCYYVSVDEKYCPFKQREHQRDSAPLYVEINVNGVFIKCYDQECLRRRYPERGYPLPPNFDTDYKDLHLSMTTRYWNTDVALTPEIKQLLEDSLNGSHYKIAKTLFTIYRDRFRVDDIRNTDWYEFDGVRWKKSHSINLLVSEELPKYFRGIKISDTSVDTDTLKDYLVNQDKADANYRNQLVDNVIAKLENVGFKNNILTQLAYMFKHHDPDFYKNLDTNSSLIGFKNGIYDVVAGCFRKGDPSDCITFSTGYDFLEYDETLPQVHEIYQFLQKIIPNDRVREYTLKVLGKSLIGQPDERFYIWTGISGANGKSTLVNFLEHTLGDYITSVDVSLLTNKRANASNASPDIMRLRGRRMFTFQEPEHDDKLRTGILKQYTGGDTIVARELFKAPVSFKLQGTMLMCCNDLPAVASIDGGTWRRIRVVEFKSRFCDNPVKPNEFKIDPTIKHKLKEWRPFFMSILIHWFERFREEGIDEPDEVRKATSKYKVDNDKFNDFFDACLQECPQSFETNKAIYAQFCNWWTVNYPVSKTPDCRDLRRALKVRFGDERECLEHGITQYGFNVKLTCESASGMIPDDAV